MGNEKFFYSERSSKSAAAQAFTRDLNYDNGRLQRQLLKKKPGSSSNVTNSHQWLLVAIGGDEIG